MAETGDAFVSIPVSNSDESQLLRIAYGQRVISFALQKTVWLPFSSEKTFSEPKLVVALLAEILNEVEKSSLTSNGSRRAATVWKALTVRALHSMSAASTPNTYVENRETSSAQLTSCRAEKVVCDVVKDLSPLLNMSEVDKFKEELLHLAHVAISVWASAEADEPHFIIETKLDRANHAKWRSEIFEPLLGDGEPDVGIPSSTRERIYTLFPRIIAQKYIKPAEKPPILPGSWHDEEQQPPAMEVLYIHHGIGLPEWSRLVVRGQEEEKETKEDLRKAAEEKRKEKREE